MKKTILFIMVAALAFAAQAAIEHGWLLYADKTPEENRVNAACVLATINAHYPQISKLTGKVFPYWQAAPVELQCMVTITNADGIVESVATNTGFYIVYIRPSVSGYISDAERAQVTNTLPDGCFVGGNE